MDCETRVHAGELPAELRLRAPLSFRATRTRTGPPSLSRIATSLLSVRTGQRAADWHDRTLRAIFQLGPCHKADSVVLQIRGAQCRAPQADRDLLCHPWPERHKWH